MLVQGTLPNARQRALLEAVFVASVENGAHAPSVFVPRVSASVGNDIHVALAAGLLAMGERHGGAAEQAADVLMQKKTARDIVAAFLREKKAIPGFGHKIYKDRDPRAVALYEKARLLKLPLAAFTKAHAIEAELEKMKGKRVPLNVDGAIAASLLTLQFSPKAGKALFAIPRLAGMTAHILEEYAQGNSYYRLSEDEVEEA